MTKINIKWYPAIFAILHFLINLAFNLFNYFKNGVFNNSMLLEYSDARVHPYR